LLVLEISSALPFSSILKVISNPIGMAAGLTAMKATPVSRNALLSSVPSVHLALSATKWTNMLFAADPIGGGDTVITGGDGTVANGVVLSSAMSSFEVMKASYAGRLKAIK
jgi:hypothetical protein